MNIYLGTYDGFVIVLSGQPSNLSVKACKQISQNSIRTLHFANQELLAGGYDQELRAVHPFTAVQLKQSKQTNGIINCMAKTSENTLAVGLETGAVRFWDINNWNIKRQVKQHKKAIRDMKIQTKGALLITIGGKQMIFWNVSQMKSIYHYKFQHELQHLLVNDDFSQIFLFTEKSIHQINAENNEETHKLQLQQKIQCTALFNNYILIGTQKGQIQIWAIGHYTNKIAFQAHTIRVKAIKIISIEDIDYLITANSAGEVAIWDVLQFLKNVENISQDYHLEGLKPIFSINTKHRIICMDAITHDQLAKINQKQSATKLQSKKKIQQPKQEQTSTVNKKNKKKNHAQNHTQNTIENIKSNNKAAKNKKIKKAKKDKLKAKKSA